MVTLCIFLQQRLYYWTAFVCLCSFKYNNGFHFPMYCFSKTALFLAVNHVTSFIVLKGIIRV